MKVGPVRWWLLQWLRVVVVPNRTMTYGVNKPVVKVTSPPRVGIEPSHDIAASVAQTQARAVAGEARRVLRTKRHAYYRVDEPLRGRVASGHWVKDSDGNRMVLAAIMLAYPARLNGYMAVHR